MTTLQRKLRNATTALGLCGLLAAGPAAAADGLGPHAEADWPSPVSDSRYGRVLFDRLEYVSGEDEDAVSWEVNAFYGGDYHRVWLETEGDDVAGSGGGGEIEKLDLLYGRLIAPNWDLQAGLGYQREYGPGPDRDRAFAVIGLQGLAPYWFEVDTNLRLSEDGDLSADLELEYDLLLSQRLILQPRLETAIAAREVEAFGVGKGLTGVKLGLRLRYEVRREFAPYIGVTWDRRLGDTADLAEAEGGDDEETAVVAGVRMWF